LTVDLLYRWRHDRVAHRLWGDGSHRARGLGRAPDPGAAKDVLRRALDLGVQLFDTADSYGPEVSEQLLADALHPYPRDVVVATKGGSVREGPWQLRADGRPAHLRATCEGSLRRLRLDRIDLYQLHTVDSAVPLEESVGALAQLRTEGKIRHVGLSNVTVEQIESARKIVPVVSVQRVQPRRARRPSRGHRLLRARRAGIPPLATAGEGLARACAWCTRSRRRPARCNACTGRARLAAHPLAGGRCDPRHALE
jgi:pyridoxine 4-dehydrogenase